MYPAGIGRNSGSLCVPHVKKKNIVRTVRAIEVATEQSRNARCQYPPEFLGRAYNEQCLSNGRANLRTSGGIV